MRYPFITNSLYYLSIRKVKKLWDLFWEEHAMCRRVCVCVCLRPGGGGLTGTELQCLAKGAPSVFPLPSSRSQGFLGCVSRAINFSSILEMTFGGISMLRLGGVGPSFCRHDPESYHCLIRVKGICINTTAMSPLPPFLPSTLHLLPD